MAGFGDGRSLMCGRSRGWAPGGRSSSDVGGVLDRLPRRLLITRGMKAVARPFGVIIT